MNIAFIFFFTSILLKSKYRNSFFGIFLTILFPILSSVFLSYIFSGIYKQSFDTFFLKISLGFIPWYFFTRTLIDISNSLNNNIFFVKKKINNVYNVSLSYLLSGILDFLLNISVLIMINIFFLDNVMHLKFFLFIFTSLLFFIFTYSLGLIFSIFCVIYKDFINLVVFFVQILFFLSPIIYEIKNIFLNLQIFINLNPLTTYIEMFRGCFNLSENFYFSDYLLIFIITITIMTISLYLFKIFKKRIVFYL
jgi:lipopolysaccharide transport system permease protein